MRTPTHCVRHSLAYTEPPDRVEGGKQDRVSRLARMGFPVNDVATADMDGGWKQVIEDYTEEFFRFFFPEVHAAVDFSQDYRFLDTELHQIIPNAEVGKKEADKLVEVHRRDGRTEWILIHVEVQSQREADFAERMFVYNYRIGERYKKPVVSLALLVDGDPNFRPQHFCREYLGCRLEFGFPMVKLLDYKSEDELTRDRSPFAVASLVQLRKLQAGSDMERRYHFKLSLARELYHRGYGREDVLRLFRFMDYILTLPDGLSNRFRREIESVEEELKMPYITSVERIAREQGIEQGIEQGVEQGVRGAVFQALEVRFGQIPNSLRDKIEQCRDLERLRVLHRDALSVDTLTDLRL